MSPRPATQPSEVRPAGSPSTTPKQPFGTPSPAEPGSVMRRMARAAALPVFLTLVAFVLYAPSLRYPFVFDDPNMVFQNAAIRSFDLGRMLAPDQLGGFRPIGILSLAIDHSLAGDSPAFYRAENLALYALVSWLVFALARVSMQDTLTAVLASVVFLVQPIHSEVVVQAVGRFELLAAALGLAALVVHARSQSAASRSVAALLLALATFAKESAFGLFAMLPILDLVRARAWGDRAAVRRVLRESWRTYVVAAVVAVLVVAIRYRAIGHVVNVSAGSHGTLSNPVVEVAAPVRIWTAFDVVARYARLLAVPIELCADYSFASIAPVVFPHGIGAWLGAGLIALGAATLIRSWKRRDGGVAVALSVVAASFAIASNIPFAIFTIMGERLVFLPSSGVCILVARAARRCFTAADGSAGMRSTARMLVITCVGLLALRTIERVPDWSSNGELFRASLRVNPNNAKMLMWVGVERLEQGDLASAEALLRRATEILPQWPDPRVGLARALILLDRTDDANRELGVAELTLGPDNSWLRYHRGLIALRWDRFDEAVAHFAAARQPPWTASASFNFGYSLLRAGRMLDAAIAYLEALDRFPGERRVERERPRLREALTALAAGDESASCAEARAWATAWLTALDRTGSAAAPGASAEVLIPPRTSPCPNQPSVP